MTNRRTSGANIRAETFFTGVLMFCAFIAAVILVNWIIDQINLAVNGEPNLNTLSQSEMKYGLFVTGAIDAASGPYAEEYTVSKYGRRSNPISDNYLYLVPIYSKGGDFIECFVSYEARTGKDIASLDFIVKDTEEGRRATPLELKHGRMINLHKDQKIVLENWATAHDYRGGDSFVEYCAKNNLLGTRDKDVILSKILTYSIYRVSSAGVNFADILYPVVPSVFCLLAVFLSRRRKNVPKERFPRQEDFDNSQQM